MPINSFTNSPYIGPNYNQTSNGLAWSPFDSNGNVSVSNCQPDSFVSNNTSFKGLKTEGENEEKGFTAEKGINSFIKGFTKPVIEMLKHPIQSLGIAAGLGFLIKKVPKAGKFVAIAGLLVGGFQLLSGFGKTVSGIVDGNEKKAEEGCESMGTGTFSTLVSFIGKGCKANRPTSGNGSGTGIRARIGGYFTRVKQTIFGNRNATPPTPPAPAPGSTSSNWWTDFRSRLDTFYSNNIKGKSQNDVADALKKEGKVMVNGLPAGVYYQSPFASYYNLGKPSSEAVEGHSAETESSHESGGEEEKTVFKIGDDALKRIGGSSSTAE